MASPTLDEIGQALVAADKAGDVEAAKVLAAEYDRLSKVGTAQKEGAAPPAGAAGAAGAAPSANGVPDRTSPGRFLRFATQQVPAEIAKQGISLGMFPGEVLRSGVNALAGDPTDFGAGTQFLHNKIDELVPPPETRSGQIGVRLTGGAAGAAGAAAAGVGTVTRNVIANALGTAGSEVGAELGDKVMPGGSGRVIGGFLGGVVGGGPASVTKGQGSYRQMLAEAIKGLEPGDFRAAQRLAMDAKAHGIDLTPEQLFDKSSGLDDLVNAVLRSGAGDGKLQSRVMGTGVNTQGVAQNAGNKIGPRVDLAEANRDIRMASEGAIRDAGTTSPAVGRLFREGEAVMAGAEVNRLDAALEGLQASYQGSRETAAAIQDLRNRLAAVTQRTQVQTGTRTTVEPGKGAQKWRQGSEPVMEEVNLGARAGDVDTVVKSVEAILKDIGVGTPAMEKLLTGRVGGAVKQLKDSLDTIITTRPQGAALYRSMKDRQEALTSSIVGRMAGRTGVNEALPDPKGVITSNIGGNYPQDKELGVLASTLRERAARAKAAGDTEAGNQASRAFPQAARVKYDEAVHSAFDGGANVGAGGAALADKLIGNSNPVKEANFKAMIMGSQEVGRMQSPEAVADGFLAMLRALRASSRNRSGNLPAPGGTEIGPSAAKIAGKTAAVAPLSPGYATVVAGRGIVDRLTQVTHQRQYEKLSKIFNDPNALELLQELGKTPLGTSRSGAILNTLIGATGTPTAPLEGEQNVQK